MIGILGRPLGQICARISNPLSNQVFRRANRSSSRRHCQQETVHPILGRKDLTESEIERKTLCLGKLLHSPMLMGVR